MCRYCNEELLKMHRRIFGDNLNLLSELYTYFDLSEMNALC
jgi:hypothetical protein